MVLISLCFRCGEKAAMKIPQERHRKEFEMLYYALVFLVIAILAAILGFTGLAGTAVGIAKVLFFLFLIAFVVSLVMGYRGRGGPRMPPL